MATPNLQKAWTKQVAVAKVFRTLIEFSLKTDRFVEPHIHGDLLSSWERTGKSYLFHIIPNIKKEDIEKKSFKDTLEYCTKHNLRFVIITWAVDTKLYDYTMDLEDDDSLPFKIIEFKRMAGLLKEFMEVRAK